MTVTESKSLKKGDRIYWQGNLADSGMVTDTTWDAVTVSWNNGHVARMSRGDMREIQRAPIKDRQNVNDASRDPSIPRS